MQNHWVLTCTIDQATVKEIEVKNPQHKKEYRHSACPVRIAVDEDSDDVPTENDLNDSLPDDEDEEEEYEPTDEDSDWQPEKDDEKEDVEELLKEAKRFMRRKK